MRTPLPAAFRADQIASNDISKRTNVNSSATPIIPCGMGLPEIRLRSAGEVPPTKLDELLSDTPRNLTIVRAPWRDSSDSRNKRTSWISSNVIALHGVVDSTIKFNLNSESIDNKPPNC